MRPTAKYGPAVLARIAFDDAVRQEAERLAPLAARALQLAAHPAEMLAELANDDARERREAEPELRHANRVGAGCADGAPACAYRGERRVPGPSRILPGEESYHGAERYEPNGLSGRPESWQTRQRALEHRSEAAFEMGLFGIRCGRPVAPDRQPAVGRPGKAGRKRGGRT